MSQNNVSAPVQPPDPVPNPQQPAIGAGLAAGIAQGAARSFMARLMDKFLSNPPDWLKALWDGLPRPWEH
ncbi:hypothetical protein ACFU93_32120 [Streptomyces sp. NPDC057611]|uniref:hypothetical protein n=1 Tax=Streptomyces sp. NPDC057611 TaxID=3346182 RepID=UPI003698AAAA